MRQAAASQTPESTYQEAAEPFAQERPVMDARFPLAQAAAAHSRMEAGNHVGKIVLEI